jgi:hypothetical protein
MMRTFRRLHKDAKLFKTTFKQNSTFIAPKRKKKTIPQQRVAASDLLSASLKSWLSHKLMKNFLPAVRGQAAMNKMRR